MKEIKFRRPAKDGENPEAKPSYTLIPNHTADKNGNPKARKGRLYWWSNQIIFCRYGSFKLKKLDAVRAELTEAGYIEVAT